MEREEEKKKIEEFKRLQELEESEMAKKKFLSSLGKDKSDNIKKSNDNNGPVKVKRVLVTQTKVDDDGFECTEDVWVEVPYDQSIDTISSSKDQPKIIGENKKSNDPLPSTPKNSQEPVTITTTKKSQKATATGESKQKSIQAFFSKGV